MRRSARAHERLPTSRGGGLEHVTCLRVCIGIDLLLEAHSRRHAPRRESMMRHFLAVALAPLGLSSGMTQAAAKRLLVAVAGPPHAVAPRLSGAGRRAIPLAVIAAPAHPHLLLAARTVPHPITVDVDRPTSSPKRLDVAGESGHAALRDTRNRSQRTPRRLEEVSPRAFTFCGACSCYRAGDRKKTLGAFDRQLRGRRGRTRIRSTKQMDRLKLW